MYPCCGALGQETGVELSLVYNTTAPLIAELEWLVPKLSSTDQGVFRGAFCDSGGRSAYDNRDYERMAFHISGGDDGKVTSECGKNLVATFLSLDEKYGALYGPGPAPSMVTPSIVYTDPSTGQQTTVAPGPTTAPPVYTTQGAGMGIPWWMWPLIAVGAYFAVTKR